MTDKKKCNGQKKCNNQKKCCVNSKQTKKQNNCQDKDCKKDTD